MDHATFGQAQKLPGVRRQLPVAPSKSSALVLPASFGLQPLHLRSGRYFQGLGQAGDLWDWELFFVLGALTPKLLGKKEKTMQG